MKTEKIRSDNKLLVRTDFRCIPMLMKILESNPEQFNIITEFFIQEYNNYEVDEVLILSNELSKFKFKQNTEYVFEYRLITDHDYFNGPNCSIVVHTITEVINQKNS